MESCINVETEKQHVLLVIFNLDCAIFMLLKNIINSAVDDSYRYNGFHNIVHNIQSVS